jgi:membrane protease subunit HflK
METKQKRVQHHNPEGTQSDLLWTFKYLEMFILILVGCLLALYILSGIFIVRPDERCVTQIFGRVYKGDLYPGIHFNPPWPFGTIYRVKVKEIRTIAVGASIEGSGTYLREFLTGDENILEIGLAIQYTAKMPLRHFLFNLEENEKCIRDVSQAALLDILSRMSVDTILTIGRIEIRNHLKRNAQAVMDRLGAGIYIVSINLTRLSPHPEVTAAFRDVADAREDRNRYINDALGYRESEVEDAKGKASAIISEAKAYERKVVREAKGDTSRFLANLREFEKSEEITLTRLYLESMEKILKNVKKMVVEPDFSSNKNR